MFSVETLKTKESNNLDRLEFKTFRKFRFNYFYQKY